MKYNETLQRLSRISNGFMEARILMAGVELGIFERLAGGSLDASHLAETLSLSLRGLTILADALVAHGYLGKEEERYMNLSEMEPYLIRDSKDSVAYILGHRANMFKKWAQLDETIRTGTPPKDVQLDTLNDPESNKNFIMGMAEVSKKRLGPILDRLPLENARHFVDVGGGPAQYVCEAARRFVNLKATVVDLPLTIEIACEQIEKQGLAERVDTKVCDFFSEDQIPICEPADVVLISNIFHAEGPDENLALLKKVYAVTQQGATVAIVENLVEENRTSPKEGAMFAVNMLSATMRGGTYTKEEINTWLTDAGFTAQSCEQLAPRTWIIIALRH